MLGVNRAKVVIDAERDDIEVICPLAHPSLGPWMVKLGWSASVPIILTAVTSERLNNAHVLLAVKAHHLRWYDREPMSLL